LSDFAKESKRDVLANIGRAFYVLKGRYPSAKEIEEGPMAKLIEQLGMMER